MATHENELTEPVDLCTPDGLGMNPAALGWSRHPLHRANLQGHFGINKRWNYWAVLAGDLLVSSVYARSDEHTSELQSLMRISYAVFCLKKKTRSRLQHEE